MNDRSVVRPLNDRLSSLLEMIMPEEDRTVLYLLPFRILTDL